MSFFLAGFAAFSLGSWIAQILNATSCPGLILFFRRCPCLLSSSSTTSSSTSSSTGAASSTSPAPGSFRLVVLTCIDGFFVGSIRILVPLLARDLEVWVLTVSEAFSHFLLGLHPFQLCVTQAQALYNSHIFIITGLYEIQAFVTQRPFQGA